jgi:antitoxin component HigA of HigAB toxin-antitoxin module
VLSGKRPLTLKRIQKLAGFFGVAPAMLLPPSTK